MPYYQQLPWQPPWRPSPCRPHPWLQQLSHQPSRQPPWRPLFWQPHCRPQFWQQQLSQQMPYCQQLPWQPPWRQQLSQQMTYCQQPPWLQPCRPHPWQQQRSQHSRDRQQPTSYAILPPQTRFAEQRHRMHPWQLQICPLAQQLHVSLWQPFRITYAQKCSVPQHRLSMSTLHCQLPPSLPVPLPLLLQQILSIYQIRQVQHPSQLMLRPQKYVTAW